MHYAMAVLPIAVTSLAASACAYQDVVVSAGGRLVGTVALEKRCSAKADGLQRDRTVGSDLLRGEDLRGPGVAAAPVLQSGSGQAVPRHGGKNPAAGDRIGPRDHGIFLN